MEKISFTTSERFIKPTTKATSERAVVLESFLKRLNPSRVAAGYKEMTGAQIGVKLAHIKDLDDLYAFYKMCDQYRGGFSRCFFGALKTGVHN